jgi:thiosulfate/3-mercaptopyruvate sulfurtransferase
MSDIEVTELSERLGTVTVVDVRRPEEYDGSFGAPCDPRQGHIPGAVNFDLGEMGALSHEDVNARLGVAQGDEIVAYCHSGSRSAMAVEMLTRLGYDARNYTGSWHEWSRTELPFVTGSEPG